MQKFSFKRILKRDRKRQTEPIVQDDGYVKPFNRNKILIIILAIVGLLGFIGGVVMPDGFSQEDKHKQFSYQICRDDPTIDYYDRVEDLVFTDQGIKGCEKITIVYVEPQEMYYGSGDRDTMSFKTDGYSDRDWNREDFDENRYKIVR